MRQPSSSRLAAWLLAVLVALLLPTSALAQPSEESVRRIARQLQCPVCEGQNVADSNSGLAQDMRTVIREQVAQGRSDQEILDFFVAAYGDGILTDPPKRGVTLGVWIGPVVAMLAGAGLLALLLPSWVRRQPTPTAATEPSIDGTVEDEYKRFREEFSR